MHSRITLLIAAPLLFAASQAVAQRDTRATRLQRSLSATTLCSYAISAAATRSACRAARSPAAYSSAKSGISS